MTLSEIERWTGLIQDTFAHDFDITYEIETEDAEYRDWDDVIEHLGTKVRALEWRCTCTLREPKVPEPPEMPGLLDTTDYFDALSTFQDNQQRWREERDLVTQDHQKRLETLGDLVQFRVEIESEWNATEAHVWADGSHAAVASIFEQLVAAVSSTTPAHAAMRMRWPWFGVAALLYHPLNWWVPFDQPQQMALPALAVAFGLRFFALRLGFDSGFILLKRHEHVGFLERNKDKIILSIITTCIGVAIGWLLRA